jgi:Holliday junction resolvase RusA-like endonuclease
MPPIPSQRNINLTVRGRIPSKKNSRVCFVRGGKMINIPSKQYTEWNKDALKQINPVTKKYCALEKVRVSLDFWAPDKRATDLSNKAESIMDLLVDACILKDDNWWVVRELILTFKGIDKLNPRCDITIIQE